MRPWRLSTENPNLFHAARLMREEDDRQKQKIMHAAGMHIDEDQAPIAGSSNDRSSSTNKDNGSASGGGSGIAAESGLAGREQHQPQQQRGEYQSGPAVLPPNGREGGLTDVVATGSMNPYEGDGASVDGRHNDASPDAASTNSNHVCSDRERKVKGNDDGGEGEDGSHSGEVCGLDIENDVRKRVLDLVRVLRFKFLNPH